MFWPDVIAYRRFYESRLGQITARAIRRHLRRRWGHVSDCRIITLGYGIPIMRSFNDKKQLASCFMPAVQGAIHWPAQDKNRTLLTDETELPLADNSVERVILIHLLEHTYDPKQVMQEVWRILTPSGRVMIYTPNRRSIWARVDNTPFGYGRPFNAGQLERLLADQQFTLIDDGNLLFYPPTRRPSLQRFIPVLNRIGAVLPWFGGLVWAEAEKQIFAAIPKDGLRERARRPLFAPATEPALGVRMTSASEE